MLRSVLLLLLLVPGLAVAQTCGGALVLPLARSAAPGDSAEWTPASTFYFDAAITAVSGEEHPEAAPLDWFLARADRFEIDRDSLPSRHSGLLQPPDTMRVWTQCGYALLRFAITDRWERETMTLDLYDVPAHVPIRPSRPVPFRPGRWTLDVGDAITRGPYPGLVFDVDRLVRRE